MRRIELASEFKRDYKRIERAGRYKSLGLLVSATTDLLRENTSLPDRNRDHALKHDWQDHRECHLKPDLLLVYQLPDDETLRLVRLGSHNDLFS